MKAALSEWSNSRGAPQERVRPGVATYEMCCTFGGNGNLTQVDAVAGNGNIPLVWRPGTGTYTLNSDCTGTMTLINQRQAPLHLAMPQRKSDQDHEDSFRALLG